MNPAYEVFFLTQWLVYLVRLVLTFAYGVLQFIAKPGSRYIVPVIVAGVGYYYLETIEPLVVDFVYTYNTRSMPTFMATAQRQFQQAYYGHVVEPWMVHAGLAALFLIACYAYVLFSRGLAVVIGAFPKLTRPLRPLRRLRPTNLKIKSAVVQLAVPKLRF